MSVRDHLFDILTSKDNNVVATTIPTTKIRRKWVKDSLSDVKLLNHSLTQPQLVCTESHFAFFADDE